MFSLLLNKKYQKINIQLNLTRVEKTQNKNNSLRSSGFENISSTRIPIKFSLSPKKNVQN